MHFILLFTPKKINVMTSIYLHVFDNNESNPSFHEEQLLAIAARSGFGWMFLTHWQALYKWKFSRKKNKTKQNNDNNSKNNLSLSLLNHISCVEFIVFPSTNQKNWYKSFSNYSATTNWHAWKTSNQSRCTLQWREAVFHGAMNCCRCFQQRTSRNKSLFISMK